jgi:hypothetical protein
MFRALYWSTINTMKIRTLCILALGVVMGLAVAEVSHAEEPSSGEIIGEVVMSSSRDMASGVAIVSHATADTLDSLTWAGCSTAKWAVGERRDRKASIGNTVVGLVFRLPVTLLSGGLCATSAILSMPAKGFGYGFDVLAGAPSGALPDGPGASSDDAARLADIRSH